MAVCGTASLFYLIGCVPVFSWRTPGKSLVVAANQSKALRFLDSATKATLLTFPPFGKTTVLLLLVFLSLPFRSYAADLPSREQVIARLKHHEGQVQSIQAEFEVLHVDTSKEMVPRIMDYYQRVGKADRWNRGIFPDNMSSNNYDCKWLRKGTKEREEKILQSGSRSTLVGRTTAFDGRLLRIVYDRKEYLGGEIYTAKESNWNSMPRKTPMTILYEAYGQLFSDCMAAGSTFHIRSATLNGVPHIRVLFGDEHNKLALYFDRDWRIVQHDRIGVAVYERKEAITSRAFLKDYRAYKDANGETFWFPQQVVYQYFTGPTQEDNPMVNRTETLKIKHIRFNIDIPDDSFVLPMPKDVPIRIGKDVPASMVPEGIRRFDPAKAHQKQPSQPPK